MHSTGLRACPLYFFQKKLGIIVETDYCGSFRIQPVVDAFFAEVPCATMMKSAEGHSILEFLDGLEP